MSKVILKNVVKSYDNKKNIIDGIDLEINDKEFIVLVGSSGCGKSTILRLISGLEDITSGDILIDNKVVNNVHPKDRDIAFVFQSYALYPHMNVYDNIAFGLKMRKTSKDDIDKKVRKAAASLNLTDLLDRKPKQLSGGQRQRVALGRAIVRNPKVFLMDEPLSNLDANLRVNMRAEIKRLHKELGTTFIYVTHDQTEALTMGDRIVILDKGKIQQVDNPITIYNKPKNMFVAGFIGQMNFINIQLKENVFTLNDEVFELPENLTGRVNDIPEIVVGIRPEKMLSGNKFVSAETDIVEICGSDKNVYVQINGSKCVAKLPLEHSCDKTTTLKLSVEDMYFFNKKSGESLYN